MLKITKKNQEIWKEF